MSIPLWAPRQPQRGPCARAAEFPTLATFAKRMVQTAQIVESRRLEPLRLRAVGSGMWRSWGLSGVQCFVGFVCYGFGMMVNYFHPITALLHL